MTLEKKKSVSITASISGIANQIQSSQFTRYDNEKKELTTTEKIFVSTNTISC